MIDFDKGEEKLNKYMGSERKTTVLFKNVLYLIKYPDPIRDTRNELSYMNNQFSEHIGCCVFSACGVWAQETVLGLHTDVNGREKLVVGCKDFTQDGSVLHEFSKLASQIIIDGSLGTTIENVNTVIEKSRLIIDKKSIIDGFWNMFVIDALFANPDRHMDNWGILEKNGEILFAPVYDCGSSLGALLDDKKMEELLLDATALKNKEYNVTSCYSMNGKRIFYHEIFSTPPPALSESINRIVPRINMEKVSGIVNSVSKMTEIRKEYLLNAMELRYKQILAPALQKHCD